MVTVEQLHDRIEIHLMLKIYYINGILCFIATWFYVPCLYMLSSIFLPARCAGVCVWKLLAHFFATAGVECPAYESGMQKNS